MALQLLALPDDDDRPLSPRERALIEMMDACHLRCTREAAQHGPVALEEYFFLQLGWIQDYADHVHTMPLCIHIWDDWVATHISWPRLCRYFNEEEKSDDE